MIAVTGTTRGGALLVRLRAGAGGGGRRAWRTAIYNAGPGQRLRLGDGTSDSSRHRLRRRGVDPVEVPGALDAPDVINRIIRTARDAGAPGRDPRYGFGRIDPVAALTADVPSVAGEPAARPPPDRPAPPPPAAAEDDEFDVTQHGDRGGPTDQQVMVIGIGIAVAVVLLLALVVFLIWNRRRHRREAGPGGASIARTMCSTGSPDAGWPRAPRYPPPSGYAPTPVGHRPAPAPGSLTRSPVRRGRPVTRPAVATALRAGAEPLR